MEKTETQIGNRKVVMWQIPVGGWLSRELMGSLKEVVLGFRLGGEAFGNPSLGRVQGFQLNQQTRLGRRR